MESQEVVRVHNLMHKIILSKSQDDNFCTVWKESSTQLAEKSRRISTQGSGFKMAQQDFTCTRTLFMFGVDASVTCWSRPVVNFPSLKLLKVLHLEAASFDRFPSEIVELLLLRYLCLSNTRISSIPKSLGMLRHLETLDLKQTFVRKLPKAVTKLDKLRHLLVCQYSNIGSGMSFDCVKGFDISAKIGTLKNLQKLSFLKAKRHRSHELIQALGNLTQLRKLGIIDLRRYDGPNLCQTIQRLGNLRSLNVTSLHKGECLDLQEITHPPILHRLCLKGSLERLPLWVSRLHDLTRIRLKWSKLGHNRSPIEILEDLPNLLELHLLDAYTGLQLDFFAGKFQKLKILQLEKMERLRVVLMERRTLPCLQKLIIKSCSHLEQVPIGIGKLTHLKELILGDMPQNFVNQLKRRGELRHLVDHIPYIQAYYNNSNGEPTTENLS